MKTVRNTKTGRDVSIQNGVLYFEDARQCPVDDERLKEIIGDGYTNAIRVISLEAQWVQTVWLTGHTTIKETINMQMTLRREIRSGRGHWYAYRRVMGHLFKRYVGTDDAITQQRLLDIAVLMPST